MTAALLLAASVFARSMERVETMDGAMIQGVYTAQAVALVYDKAKVPTPPRTLDELIAIARPLTGEGRYGFVSEWASTFVMTVLMLPAGEMPKRARRSWVLTVAYSSATSVLRHSLRQLARSRVPPSFL